MLILVFLNASCSPSSPESKAQKGIEEYMKKNINDPKGYESVAFRELRIDSTSATDQSYYKELQDSADLVEKKKRELATYIYSHSYMQYLDKKISLADQLIKLYGKQAEFIMNFKGSPRGFGMMHVFRKKNSKGATELDSMYFRLDSSFQVRPESYYYLINEDRSSK